MEAALATLVVAVGIVGLFRLYRDRESRVSHALWLPVAWFSLGGSRTVTQWLGAGMYTESPDQYLDGSPIDRAIFSVLIVASLVILIARWERTREVLARNWPLLLFLLFCAVSVAWSEFPFVALKRWTKTLGNVAMMMIVLTEFDPLSAIKQLLARAAFVLIPVSVLVILFYSEIGTYYRPYAPVNTSLLYAGVASNKNMLGCLCMILGLGILSQIIDVLQQATRRGGRLLALGVVLGMDLWLLNITNSATGVVCFVFGVVALVVLRLAPRERAKSAQLLVVGATVLGVVTFACYVVFRGVLVLPVEMLGRDPTLNGRDELWRRALELSTNPWIGTGFESFFLGPRLERLWALFIFHPNQAHNGYLETYLTLGFVGLGLLGLVMIVAFRDAMRLHSIDPRAGGLVLAYLAIAPIYNLTEAAFKVMHPFWIISLLAIAAASYLPARMQARHRADGTDTPTDTDTLTLERTAAARGAALVLSWLGGRRG